MTIAEELIQIVQELDEDQQKHMLTVARQLRQSQLPPGTPGHVLIALLDELTFAEQNVDEMMTPIRESEGIDWDGWR